MVAELQRLVLPDLRNRGFTGTFPHLRRTQSDHIELITFQFDRAGGGLVIELCRCPATGGTTAMGEAIVAKTVTAWDFNQRKRIQTKPGSGVDSWFRFDSQTPTAAAKQIAAALGSEAVWTDVPIARPGPASIS